MNIVVSAAALQTSGALTIYKQFIEHLAQNITDNHYYVFVSERMPQPQINGVEYIVSNCNTGLKRIIFDSWGCKHYFKKRNIRMDCVVCLQNTSVNVPKGCSEIIYYHQSLPFYKNRWNPFRKEERALFLYKYFYPFFVGAFLRDDTQVVVQIPFIKKAFAKYFKHPESNIKVLFPDVVSINAAEIEPKNLDEEFIHIVYPATAFKYKNHEVLCDALGRLREINPNKLQKIRLHLTMTRDKCTEYLKNLIKRNDIEENIVFDGVMPFNDLLALYKAADALVFPSTVETLGLPLVEAATFGLPIIAADLPYAREVLGEYAGAKFIAPKEVDLWTDALNDITPQQRVTPLKGAKESSWNDFFQLIY